MTKFGELWSEAIDITIKGTFGMSASSLIYELMERQASLKREELGEKIDAFHTYMEKLLGSEVALIVHASSLRILCDKLRREYEEVENYFSVLDELYEIKFKLLVPSSLKEQESLASN